MTRLPDGLTERLNPPKFFAVRPGSVTERPIGAAIMGADALSDILRAVRLSSAMFFHLDVRAPWVAAGARIVILRFSRAARGAACHRVSRDC